MGVNETYPGSMVPEHIHKTEEEVKCSNYYFLDVFKIMGTGLKDKAHGGEFKTIFRHGDEAENSICLALFPEFVQMENAVDTKAWGFLPEGYI